MCVCVYPCVRVLWKGAVEVQWLCRVQLPTVWKAELATGMTLHGAVCQSPDGHG